MMNASDSQGQLSLETLKRLDAVCAAYELAWQKDNPPRIEQFLGDAAEPERRLILLELLKLDAELRSNAGLSLATEELRSRFPEYSELFTGLESKNIADDATMPPRDSRASEPSGREAPASGQTIDTEATPTGYEDLPFLAPPSKPGSIGRLGHYDIQGVVGRGGMGVVLKAFDEKLHRVVAIKVLGPQFATNAAARRRFEREAKAAAAVSHDHIVPIYHVDEFQGVPFLVMPLIVGKSLQDRLDESGPVELKALLRIGNQIAEGLAAAHKKGLVHRDIKPGNILLENGVERVKITDFGLARAVDDASVTQSGVITGTPMYMAPEQARGEQVDHRADLFSLGSVLYAMCTGHPPFRATGTHAVLMRVIEDTPRSIRESNPELPDWLEAIIAKLHAKKPEERFQTAKEVAELLEQHLAHLQQPHVAPKPAAIGITRPADAPTRQLILDGTDRKTGWIQGSVMLGSVSLGLAGVLITLLNLGIPNAAGAVVIGMVMSILALVGAGSLFFVKQRFQVAHRGHIIQCEKSLFWGEALYVDGRCADREMVWGGRGTRQRLAAISEGEGVGDTIVAELKTGWWQVDCRIFVEYAVPRPAHITRVRAADKDSREMILEQSDRQTRWLQRALMAGSAGFFIVGFLMVGFNRGHDGLKSVGVILCGFGLGGLVAVAGVKQRFRVRYRGHSIRCEKNIYLGESLFVDGRRVDRKRSVGWQGSEELRAVIADGEGAGDTIVAEIDTSLAQVDCRIFVEARPGSFRQANDTCITEEAEPVRAQPSIGKRLAWSVAGYTLAACVLFVFIAAYSDNGWWSTPWIEFGAIIGFLFLAGLHMMYRPRWLAVLPVSLAIFFAFLGAALWPYSTARHFTRLVHEAIRTRGYVQANEMLTSRSWTYANHLLTIEARDGRKVTLSEDDFPLEAFDANLDRFLENSDSDVFRFRITSRWVQDCYCELHMTSSFGTVSCDAIEFRHAAADPVDPSRRTIRTITAQEWMQAHGAAAPPTVAARLPEAADEVLPAMVGAWKLDVTNSVWSGKPVAKQTTGVAAVDWSAGKQFLRVRVQTTGGPDGIQIMAFDPRTQDFKAWIFDAYGVISGPSVGRWEPKSRTLTWTGLPQADTVGVKTLRFVDANTVQGEITFRNKAGNVTLQVRDTMTRFAGPADVREDASSAPVPPEMAVLHKQIGVWETKGRSQAQAAGFLKLPLGMSPLSKRTTAKTLGNRFIETHETLTGFPKDKNYALATYDVTQRGYRMWTFNADGYSNELRGSWDAKTERMGWTWSEPEIPTAPHNVVAAKGSAVVQWRGSDRVDTTVDVTNFAGVSIADVQSTSTRQAETIALVGNQADGEAWAADAVWAGQWVVKDGVLIGTGGDDDIGISFNQRGDFKDFRLRMEARLDRAGDAALYFRSRGPNDRDPAKHPKGYWVHLSANTFENPTGLLAYAATPISVPAPPIALPPDEWFTLEISAIGKDIAVAINGKETAKIEDPHALARMGGHFALKYAKTKLEVRRFDVQPLPSSLNADAPRNVLPRMIGTWNFTSTITIPKNKKQSTGVAIIEPVADGKFMRFWSGFDDGAQENMAVQTYDEAAGKFQNWFFTSAGDSHGPGTGVWDPHAPIPTLTWRETLVGEMQMTQVIHFRDADAFDSHLTYKMLSGEVAIDQRVTYRRANQVVTPKVAPVDSKRPQVLKSLDGLAGHWRTDLVIKREPTPDEPFRVLINHHLRPILAGHFFEAHEEDNDRSAMRSYWVLGRSGSGNHYRLWHFNVGGGHLVSNGAWDESQKQIGWIATDGSTDGHWKMASPTERNTEFTANDRQGKFLFHAKGVAKKLPFAAVKTFTPDHTLLPTDNAQPDPGQGGWRIDSTGKGVVRLFEMQHPGVDNCIVLFKAKLKTQKMEGGASLEMWARLVDQEFWSKGEGEHQVAGTTNWSEYQIPFRFEKGQFPNRLQLGLRLGGAGTVWIKDVEVSYQPLGLFGGRQK